MKVITNEFSCPECKQKEYNFLCQYCNENRYLPKQDELADMILDRIQKFKVKHLEGLDVKQEGKGK